MLLITKKKENNIIFSTVIKWLIVRVPKKENPCLNQSERSDRPDDEERRKTLHGMKRQGQGLFVGEWVVVPG